MKPDARLGLGDPEFEQWSWLKNLRSAEYSREVVLLVCSVLLMLMFAATAVVSRLYHRKVHTLADQWFARGETAFDAGSLTTALNNYRNALVYSPNNPVFQLHLAQSLAAIGRLDEAASYLANLLTESPGNGEINLELARISARKSEHRDAIRYYHSAIYGVWDTDPLMQRWRVRRELCEYLLGLGDATDAQPEIIALAQEVRAGDLGRQKLAGEFLLRANLWERAVEEFGSVLKFDPRNEEALAGAGTAAFQIGRYPEALSDFDKLPREKKTDPRLAGLIDQAREIVSANPYADGLSSVERARRTSAALKQAVSRIAACARQRGESLSERPSVSDFQKFYAESEAQARDWSEPNLARHPDRIEAAMVLVFEMENEAAQQCGEPLSGPDRALLVVGRSRERGTR